MQIWALKKVFFCGIECVGHYFAYITHFFLFLRDVWIQTQRAVIASMRTSNLDTQLSNLATHLPEKVPFELNSRLLGPKSRPFSAVLTFF
jgi:hypothetical protein